MTLDRPKVRAITFGLNRSLVGILTDPPRSVSAIDSPAVLLLNSGLLHRVGAARLHVRLARRLASAGFRVLRFDFSGIGDSQPASGPESFEKMAVREVQAGMDLLAERRRASKFILMGLCSGADVGFHTACQDARVLGVIQLDAWAYRTPGYYIRHYLSRLGNLGAWRAALRRRFKIGYSGEAGGLLPVGEGATVELSPYTREFPPREDIARDLESLIGRGVRLLNIFSGGQDDFFNHRDQYRRSFSDVDFCGLVDVEYLGDADHVFSGLGHQEFVLDRTDQWMKHWLPEVSKGHASMSSNLPGVDENRPSQPRPERDLQAKSS